MPIQNYSTDREANADIAPGNIRTDDFPQQQQINAIRQLMADLALFAGGLIGSRKVTVFTIAGANTFTADAKLLEADVYCWAGGGQGGGAGATAGGQMAAGQGGNSGAIAYRRLTAAQIGASQTATVGAGGTGAAGGANGNAGANSTFGALVSAVGGAGGTAMAAAVVGNISAISGVTQSATGDIKGWQSLGTPGLTTAVITQGGNGGTNELGGAGIGARTASGGAGGAGGGAAQANSGAGGGGGTSVGAAGATAGGNGGSGLIIVIEYLKP